MTKLNTGKNAQQHTIVNETQLQHMILMTLSQEMRRAFTAAEPTRGHTAV